MVDAHQHRKLVFPLAKLDSLSFRNSNETFVGWYFACMLLELKLKVQPFLIELIFRFHVDREKRVAFVSPKNQLPSQS